MNLTFKWELNVETKNRGFVVHQLTALHNQIEVGYIKACYIPKELFKQYYPSIWEYTTLINGWSSGLNKWNDPIAISREQKVNMMRYIYEYLNVPKDEITNEQIKDADKQIKHRFGQRFKEFRGYHVDRPYIAFIETEKDYRRKGVATQMMLEIGKRLDEIGLKLHTTETQSNDCVKFLSTLIERYPNSLKKRKVPLNDKYDLYELNI